MFLSRQQHSGQNHDMKVNNRTSGNMAQLIYFVSTVTSIKYQVKRIFSSSLLLSKTLQIRRKEHSDVSCDCLCVRNLVFAIKGGTQTNYNGPQRGRI
jgi:hypothetical protein